MKPQAEQATAVQQDLIERLVRPELRALQAYHVPNPGQLIKLDAMENPYGWPPSLRESWLKELSTVSLNRYPDAGAAALKAQLRATFAIPEAMEILLGNGSDELIQIMMMAVAAPGRVVLSVGPTFSMYRMIAAFVGLNYVEVPLTADFSLDAAALRQAYDRHQPALVFFSYPNNPTGNLFDAQTMAHLIAACPGVVVVDEAYTPFCDASFVGQLGRSPNLLVLRTLSKLGLAGLRLGYLVGPAAWLAEFDKIRLPYNINILTQVSAAFALRHYEVLQEQTRQICQERARVYQALRALPGITVYPSDANFILLRVPPGRAAQLFAALKAEGVLIKNLHGAGVWLEDCLRVTVGTAEENNAFLAAFKRNL